MPSHRAVTPSPLTMSEALGASAPLARLRASLRESAARLETVRVAIPRNLIGHVRPGPVDDEGWTLLASNVAVAAKLRQLRPRLEDLLRESGRPVPAIRIKIASV